MSGRIQWKVAATDGTNGPATRYMAVVDGRIIFQHGNPWWVFRTSRLLDPTKPTGEFEVGWAFHKTTTWDASNLPPYSFFPTLREALAAFEAFFFSTPVREAKWRLGDEDIE